MGFVGFKTVQQAAEALRFYNHTFLDTSRIEVEVRWEHCELVAIPPETPAATCGAACS